MPYPPRRSAREMLVVGLRDAHAMERHAVAVLEGQLPSLRDFPDFRARVAAHADESRVQARRLETALAACDASPSTLKDMALSAMGFGQAAVTQVAPDAPVKAMLADSMFEHLEIAAYRALLEMVDLAEAPRLRADLELSLREEEAMADWLTGHLPELTRRFIALAARAKVAPAATRSAAPDPAPAPRPEDPAPAPEAPLRDLEEFTDPAPDPADADWPDPASGGLDRPAPSTPAPAADPEVRPEAPLRDLDEFTDPTPDPNDADWPDADDGALDRPGSSERR